MPSANLVNSYLVPPYAHFTCAPCSTRWRASKARDIARYTYTSTRSNLRTQRISLYKEYVEESGKSTSTTAQHDLPDEHQIIFISSSTCVQGSPLDEDSIGAPDLLAVSEAGHLYSLDGDTLNRQWESQPDILARDLNLPKKASLRVESVVLAPASEFISGIFGGNGEAFSVFPQPVQAGAFDPDTFLITTTIPESNPRQSHVHIITVTPRSLSVSSRQNIFLLRSAPIPMNQSQYACISSYRCDVRSGTLLRLSNDTITNFDLQKSIPKVRSELKVPGANSMLRLSKSSLLILCEDSLAIYNPVHESLQAKVSLDSSNPDGIIAAYFPREEIALSLIGNELSVAQLEPPKTRNSKRHAEGLFIDAVGKGLRGRDTISSARCPAGASLLPGSLIPGYWRELDDSQAQAEKYLEDADIVGLETLLAEKFGMRYKISNVKDSKESHGTFLGHQDTSDAGKRSTHEDGNSTGVVLEWQWPENSFQYCQVDRRWVLWAIKNVFKWTTSRNDILTSKLNCILPESNIVNYLIDAGHLSLQNLKDAFCNELASLCASEEHLVEAVVEMLVSLDPNFDLLVAYLASTQLGPLELLVLLRAIMKSLEILPNPVEAPLQLTNGDKSPTSQNIIANGITKSKANAASTAPNDEMDMEIDMLEATLRMGEATLSHDWSLLATGLSLTLSKLSACVPSAVVQSLRRVFKSEQIISLIVMLRTELIKGGWTSLYTDAPQYDPDTNPDFIAPPDDSIRVITELISRCVDAMGQGGWIASDTELERDGQGQDSSGFVEALKLEVSVALEGAESASYLYGLVNEVLMYNQKLQDAGILRSEKKSRKSKKPKYLVDVEEPSSELPLGLKVTRPRIQKEKIGKGGERMKRSKREIGHLISQKVSPYSLERIVI